LFSAFLQLESDGYLIRRILVLFWAIRSSYRTEPDFAIETERFTIGHSRSGNHAISPPESDQNGHAVFLVTKHVGSGPSHFPAAFQHCSY